MAVIAREARTVRMPLTLIREAQTLTHQGESLNDLITKSVEREVARRRTLQALDAIDELRERIRAEHGVLPNSAPLIRELRDGVGRRD
jgi:hypothetical protein